MHPYYDRSDLVQLTIDTVEHNLLLGMALVLIVLMAFLVSVRAAVIVALTIPLSLLFSFIFLHAEASPQTCFPLAQSTSEFSSTAPSLWSKISSASWVRARARITTSKK